MIALSPRGRVHRSGPLVKTGWEERERIPVNDWEFARTTVFFPVAWWKEQWDTLVMFLILYSAVMVPFRICFASEAEGWDWAFDVFLDLVFITDVAFNFNTAYEDSTMWVVNRRLIAQNYLRGWFWIDAPSSIPVELIVLIEVDHSSSNLSLLKYLRMFRMVRLLRMLKVQAMLDKITSSIEDKYGVNLSFLRIIKMVLALMFLSHLLACAWYAVSIMSHEHFGEESYWLAEYDNGRAVTGSTSVRYIYSVYWALTTLTTVGYGDITPVNDTERSYTLVALLIGWFVS